MSSATLCYNIQQAVLHVAPESERTMPNRRYYPQHRAYTGTHKRLVPPDADNRAACRCTMTVTPDPTDDIGTLRVTRAMCPHHDPRGYADYMAAHAPDSVVQPRRQ